MVPRAGGYVPVTGTSVPFDLSKTRVTRPSLGASTGTECTTEGTTAIGETCPAIGGPNSPCGQDRPGGGGNREGPSSRDPFGSFRIKPLPPYGPPSCHCLRWAVGAWTFSCGTVSICSFSDGCWVTLLSIKHPLHVHEGLPDRWNVPKGGFRICLVVRRSFCKE